MSRATTSLRAGDELPKLSGICSGLKNLARKRKLSGRDADIVRAALEELRNLERTRNDLDTLTDDLTEIERLQKLDLAKHPGKKDKLEMAACILALDAVCRFLRLRAPHDNLELLGRALRDLAAGASLPAMFQAFDCAPGRRPDAPSVMAAKGILAGIMHAKQSAGMSRERAAKWVVRHVSPTLAAQISRKPLTPRVVEEWLDRYGGDFAETNAGRKSYLVWSLGEPGSAAAFREMTEELAKILPRRKPR
jgi:hypothetical protein